MDGLEEVNFCNKCHCFMSEEITKVSLPSPIMLWLSLMSSKSHSSLFLLWTERSIDEKAQKNRSMKRARCRSRLTSSNRLKYEIDICQY